MEDRLITTTEAGKILGVSGQTVRDWIGANRLISIRTVGGKIRIRLSDAEKLLNELSQPVTTSDK